VLSSTKRKDNPAPAGTTEDAPVQAARTRAKRRLIGAAVLVGIGVIGFPLLFETQPRPIAVDIPIEIPAKDGAPPLARPPARPGSAAVARATSAAEPVETIEPVARASAPSASAPAAPVAATPSSTTAPASAAALPMAGAAAAAVAAVGAEPAARAEAADDATRRDARRAQDLLDGKAPTAAATASAASEPKGPRFVVQAGAYTDAATLREARQKVEKLGLKTYTQVVEVDGSARTRVRVGPFSTREEAEKASARIKSAGLPANILGL
jgi:DedD protein